MEARVIKVGTSLGIIIPRHIVCDGGFFKGTTVDIQYKDDKIIITKPISKRQGWAEAFAQYAKEGEDAMLLPDFLDSEAIDLM